MRSIDVLATRRPTVLAVAAVVVLLASACGTTTETGGGSLQSSPRQGGPAQTATPAETSAASATAEPSAPSSTPASTPPATQTPTASAAPLGLTDADAVEFGAQALEPYALTTFADQYRLDSCMRLSEAEARCSATIVYAIDPSRPQECTLQITVWATSSKLGRKYWDSSEVEEKTLTSSSGNHGDFRYGDTSECEAAYRASSG